MPKTILTDIAETKLTAAAGSGTQVAITHIALGDGNGANYVPGYDQTALQREKVRLPIASWTMIGSNAWRIKVEFGPETEAFGVREIGFFDADGDLIAIWGGNDVVARQTGVITYLVDHVLSFSRVADGLLIINAPEDIHIAHATASLHMQATLALQQFHLTEAYRAAHRTYPGA